MLISLITVPTFALSGCSQVLNDLDATGNSDTVQYATDVPETSDAERDNSDVSEILGTARNDPDASDNLDAARNGPDALWTTYAQCWLL